jgi:2-oxoglutarate dehydrogenase E2 component (dihydrolipoamide succinyltransferase)
VPPYPVAPQAPEPPALAPEPAALAPEPEPEPEPEPVARLDHDALDAAHGMLAALRGTIEDMGLTAARVTAEAQAVADDHGRALGRLARAAQAAARAEEAAHEAGASPRRSSWRPDRSPTPARSPRCAMPSPRSPARATPTSAGSRAGAAVIEVHLTPPSA